MGLQCRWRQGGNGRGTAMDDWLSRRWKVVTAVVVAVLVPLILQGGLALMGMFGGHKMSWGERVSRNEDYLYVSDQTLTNEDLEYIASLKRLSSLRIIDCDVAECRLRDLDFKGHELWYVDLSGTKGLWDLSFLGTIKADTVILNDCPKVDMIPELNWDELRDLEINGTSVSDLSPLANSRLRHLSFRNTNVSDVTPLAKLGGELWRVDGSYSKVSSIDALVACQDLISLCFDGCPITEIKEPFACTYLHELSLAGTQVSDLSAFSDCNHLERLNLRGVKLSDMSWLNSQCRETLTALDLGQTGLNAQDVSWVASCRDLEELVLDGIALGNLDLCQSLEGLTLLSAVNCKLTDVSGIADCSELSTVLLGYNRLREIDTIPAHDADYPDMVLDLSHNQLSSVHDLPLVGYRLLLLQGNSAGVARTLPAGVSGRMMVVDWYRGIQELEAFESDGFDTVYLLECPEEELKDMPYSWSWMVKRASEDEVLDMIEADDLDYSLFIDLGPYVREVRELR